MSLSDAVDASRPHLVSTTTGARFPLDTIAEFTSEGESLEVALPAVGHARPRPGESIFERWASFLPFEKVDPSISLGEGNTPLLAAPESLCASIGLDNLLLKDETRNPTWSFKDRGTLTCLMLARQLGEDTLATISTGNMGHSVAAYAARAGMKALVFIPHFTPVEKVQAMALHGAQVIRVEGADYADMKSAVLEFGARAGLRIVSGNGPIRTEGYKLTAFELFEQMGGRVPDFIAVPTSACGHIRGLWKGYHELLQAGLVTSLPRMIVVQAANNAPLATPIRQGSAHVIPFTNFHTIAEAITSGNPPGGDEVIAKARQHNWLAETATEEEILDGQRLLARAGHFVEPATAASVYAVRKLREEGAISESQTVVFMLTGSGLKDMSSMGRHDLPVQDCTLENLEGAVDQALAR